MAVCQFVQNEFAQRRVVRHFRRDADQVEGQRGFLVVLARLRRCLVLRLVVPHFDPPALQSEDGPPVGEQRFDLPLERGGLHARSVLPSVATSARPLSMNTCSTANVPAPSLTIPKPCCQFNARPYGTSSLQ